MNRALRPAYIAGNWKMNNNPAQTAALLQALKPLVSGEKGCRIALFVPFLDLATAVEHSAGSSIAIGAQNCHWASSGAFTGEISAPMLADCGARAVLVGHSERRQYFGETDSTVNGRLLAALHSGLEVILCVGETLEQREQGITAEVCALQTKIALLGVSPAQMEHLTLAYEPVWAIGTGKTATAAQANQVCKNLRQVIARLFSQETAQSLCILYGGSMNPGNAAELLAEPEIDGGLIGGASLKAADFAAIVKAACCPSTLEKGL